MHQRGKVHSTFFKVGPQDYHFLLLCLVTIIRLVKFSYFLVGKGKEVPMHQRTQHLDTICKSYEGSKFLLVDVLKLFLQQMYILILEMYVD